MRLGHDIEEELDRFEQEQEEKHDGERTQDGNPFRLTRPPSPPAKEPSIKLPPPLKFDHSRTPSDSPSEPPNRPLPARPPPKFTLIPRPSTGASDASTTRPPPTRPPPLRPQMPLGMNPPTRPGTAASAGKEIKLPPVMFMSEKRGSYGSSGSTTGGRILKYGRGKFSHVELVPQPSNDLEDPLVSPPPHPQSSVCKPNSRQNWPRWRKELNFWSLLLMVAMMGVMKTIFVTVNAQVALGYQVSYTSATALTGVPLIVSAVSGFLCLVASRVCGKRPLYLGALLLVFVGAVWNTNVASSYAQCMAARVFQGLAWGAFDVLVPGSIQDTYFVG